MVGTGSAVNTEAGLRDALQFLDSAQVVPLHQRTLERAIFTRLLNEIPSRIDLF